MAEKDNHIISSEGTHYSFITPSTTAPDTLIFVPGMACNKFGHPFADKPYGILADIIDTSMPNYNILIPDVNDMRVNAPKFHSGKNIEFQADQIANAYADISSREHLDGKTLFIGQSLGALAIANFITRYSMPAETNAIFLAPPTYDGIRCHESLVAMFANNLGTKVDENLLGVLQFGEDQYMSVDEEYWQSIDRNSLTAHNKQLKAKLKRVLALYATNDKYFSDSRGYLEGRLSNIESYAIDGSSHAFKTDSMRAQAKDIVRQLL